jgi:hypothetical protein
MGIEDGKDDVSGRPLYVVEDTILFLMNLVLEVEVLQVLR